MGARVFFSFYSILLQFSLCCRSHSVRPEYIVYLLLDAAFYFMPGVLGGIVHFRGLLLISHAGRRKYISWNTLYSNEGVFVYLMYHRKSAYWFYGIYIPIYISSSR